MADTNDAVDCSAVVQELYSFLDGEITDARRLQIEQHFSGCVDCHEVVEFHATLKMTISEKCRDDVPAGLRQRISLAIQQAELGSPGIVDL
jgi:mycothiol system anti-sigma-R factor